MKAKMDNDKLIDYLLRIKKLCCDSKCEGCTLDLGGVCYLSTLKTIPQYWDIDVVNGFKDEWITIVNEYIPPKYEPILILSTLTSPVTGSNVRVGYHTNDGWVLDNATVVDDRCIKAWRELPKED